MCKINKSKLDTFATMPPVHHSHERFFIMHFVNDIKVGFIYGRSQKKAVESNLGNFLRNSNFKFFNAKIWPLFAGF